jgi:alkanesulfonate monooxygenase SsuD/methylene tetrahydromethanopterin reductase-like flavin-dependent oxidoreductase (luciferase family)
MPEYHGGMADFGPMMTWPKPVQQTPPVFVGGEFPYGARRALAYGDGWLPHAKRPTYTLLEKLPEFRAMEKEAGRSIPITAFGVEHDLDSWSAYADAGVDRIVLSIDSESSDIVLPKLDEWAKRL